MGIVTKIILEYGPFIKKMPKIRSTTKTTEPTMMSGLFIVAVLFLRVVSSAPVPESSAPQFEQ